MRLAEVVCAALCAAALQAQVLLSEEKDTHVMEAFKGIKRRKFRYIMFELDQETRTVKTCVTKDVWADKAANKRTTYKDLIDGAFQMAVRCSSSCFLCRSAGLSASLHCLW